jgi:hypothetical protein
MHLCDRAMMGDLSQIHFLDDILNVRLRDRMILLDDDIAPAVQAQALAKRDVHVDRKRSR